MKTLQRFNHTFILTVPVGELLEIDLPKTDEILGGTVINNIDVVVNAKQNVEGVTPNFLLEVAGTDNMPDGQLASNVYYIAACVGENVQVLKSYGTMQDYYTGGRNQGLVNYFEGNKLYVGMYGYQMVESQIAITVDYTRVDLTAAEILAVRV